MFFRLFQKECVQTAKSLIYWLYVICLFLFFFTQMGNPGFDTIQPPKEGEEESYGMTISKDEKDIMKAYIGSLAEEWYQDSWTTYPIGFAKHVTLSQEEKQEIAEILEGATGLSEEEIVQKIETYYSQLPAEGGYLVMESGKLEFSPREGYEYGDFQKDMKKVCKILGPGSDYEEEKYSQGTSVPADYEQAMESYENYLEKDKISGGYARLFCDYMGIVLGILPVFLAVTRSMRDRRAGMKELVYSRTASSASVVLSRYAAMAVMMLLPVLAASLYILVQCFGYGKSLGVQVDLLAFFPYVFGWLLPEILTVSAVGMFFTELTDTAAAILVQGIWWFADVFASAGELTGSYGAHLILRHNSALGYDVFWADFREIAINRGFYAVLGLVLVGLTVWIYEKKRRGSLDLYGKINSHRKRKSPV